MGLSELNLLVNMSISSSKSKLPVRVMVDLNAVETSFEKWAKPGHFSRVLSKLWFSCGLDLNFSLSYFVILGWLKL